MSLQDYLESTYVQTQQGQEEGLTISSQATLNATSDILRAVKFIYKLKAYFVLLGRFLLIKVGVVGNLKSARDMVEESLERARVKNEQAKGQVNSAVSATQSKVQDQVKAS